MTLFDHTRIHMKFSKKKKKEKGTRTLHDCMVWKKMLRLVKVKLRARDVVEGSLGDGGYVTYTFPVP
jgi:hypothetical protein